MLLLASTLAVDPQAVLDRPDYLVDALVLVAAVALLSSALMESDREHRSESVLDGADRHAQPRARSPRAWPSSPSSRRSPARAIGLIVGDIDNFKAVNDEHGHSVGDAVLVDVAYALRKELRAFDMAYRLGGEEFLVLLPGAERGRGGRARRAPADGRRRVPRGRPGRDDVLRRRELARRGVRLPGAVRRRRRGALRGQARRAQPRRHGAPTPSLASSPAPRPARGPRVRPEKRQPPRNVPSSAR